MLQVAIHSHGAKRCAICSTLCPFASQPALIVHSSICSTQETAKRHGASPDLLRKHAFLANLGSSPAALSIRWRRSPTFISVGRLKALQVPARNVNASPPGAVAYGVGGVLHRPVGSWAPLPVQLPSMISHLVPECSLTTRSPLEITCLTAAVHNLIDSINKGPSHNRFCLCLVLLFSTCTAVYR
jgi:hypothetical protein